MSVLRHVAMEAAAFPRGLSPTARATYAMQITGLGALLCRLPLWRGVLVLAFHRIGDARASPFDRDVFSCDAATFETVARTLAREADVIGPDDLVPSVVRGRGRHVLLTFDDGYRDAYEVALPILRRHGLPAVFFLSTSLVGGARTAWWDELAWMVRAGGRCVVRVPACADHPAETVAIDPYDTEPAIDRLLAAYKRLPHDDAEALLDDVARSTGAGRCPAELGGAEWMTWEQARALDRAGMTIGGHTASHPVLSRTGPERQRWEIETCARELRDRLGRAMRLFSYPVGHRDSFDAHTRRCLDDCGVELAFSDYGGVATAGGWDPYDVPRANAGPGLDLARMRASVALPRLFARW